MGEGDARLAHELRCFVGATIRDDDNLEVSPIALAECRTIAIKGMPETLLLVVGGDD